MISRYLTSGLGLATFLLAATAHAGIVTSSGLNLIAPPASVQPGALTDPNAPFLFQESGTVTTASPVTVDILPDPNSPGGTFTSPADLNPFTFGAGTTFTGSYFFHFDVPARQNAGQVVNVSATFTDTIIGIILLDASLDQSDPILGNPGTSYPTGLAGRGLVLDGFNSNGIVLTVDGNSLSANFDASAGDLAQFRVLTATPEPGSIGLIASGMMGLVYMARKRQAARYLTGPKTKTGMAASQRPFPFFIASVLLPNRKDPQSDTNDSHASLLPRSQGLAIKPCGK